MQTAAHRKKHCCHLYNQSSGVQLTLNIGGGGPFKSQCYNGTSLIRWWPIMASSIGTTLSCKAQHWLLLIGCLLLSFLLICGDTKIILTFFNYLNIPDHCIFYLFFFTFLSLEISENCHFVTWHQSSLNEGLTPLQANMTYDTFLDRHRSIRYIDFFLLP